MLRQAMTVEGGGIHQIDSKIEGAGDRIDRGAILQARVEIAKGGCPKSQKRNIEARMT
jgi:hypothetical protein